MKLDKEHLNMLKRQIQHAWEDAVNKYEKAEHLMIKADMLKYDDPVKADACRQEAERLMTEADQLSSLFCSKK